MIETVVAFVMGACVKRETGEGRERERERGRGRERERVTYAQQRYRDGNYPHQASHDHIHITFSHIGVRHSDHMQLQDAQCDSERRNEGSRAES